MFNGWHNPPYKKDKAKVNSANEPISTVVVSSTDISQVIRRANEITEGAAIAVNKGFTHSCVHCPTQFNYGT